MRHCHTIKKVKEHISNLFGKAAAKKFVTRESVNAINAFMLHANQTTAIVLPFAKDIIKKLNHDPDSDIIEGKCKLLLRAFEKFIGNYDGDISKMKDVGGRIRVLIDKPEDILALRQEFLGNYPEYKHENTEAKKNGDAPRFGVLINAFPANNIRIKEFEDYCLIPSSTGRIGIHMILEVDVPGGRAEPYEMQFIHKDMLTTEEFTRDNYVKEQQIDRVAKADDRATTPSENEAKKAYSNSSKQRYKADIIRLGMHTVMRPDIRSQMNTEIMFQQDGLKIVI